MATVLIVDEEQVVIHIARIALERAWHKVFAANSGEEAELLSAEMERIDVLIGNHRVPPYTGREIAERLLQAHPTARVVHISGHPTQPVRRMVPDARMGPHRKHGADALRALRFRAGGASPAETREGAARMFFGHTTQAA